MPIDTTSGRADRRRCKLATVPRQHAMRRRGISIAALMDTGGLCLICRCRGDASAQFRSKLLGDDMRVGAIPDDLRPDEDDQFGARRGIVLMPECVAETGNLI